jgi:hypothetical protein
MGAADIDILSCEDAMGWRRWIGILGVLSLVLHASAVLRHHAVMLADALVPAVTALSADLSAICHFDPDDASSSKAHPAGAGKRCPICSGMASAFALPPPFGSLVPERVAVGGRYVIWLDQRVEQLKRIRPPGRGPPALA